MPTRVEGWGGFPIAITSSGGSEPPDAVFVHANGFCKELWEPIIDTVAGHVDPFHWVTMDQRGHGDSGVGDAPHDWDSVARDVLALVSGWSGLVGVGHSSGGTAIARAEVLQPGTFRAMVLIEPIIFPPPHGRFDIPLASIAEQRTAVFPDRATAHARFSGRAFEDWDPRVLDLYVDHGFRETERGWELKCAPEVEADYYREGNNHDTWDRLDEIHTPVVLVVGEHSDSHEGPYLSQLQARFPKAQVEVIPDAGHLLPMERPDVVAAMVASAL